LPRRHRTAISAIRSSTSTKAFITGWRRRRYRHGYWHICGWVRRGIVASHFVEWQGAPVKSVKTGFKHAVDLAGLWGKVTPHTLRHTAATWLMQRGVPIWQAAGYLGMSAQMIERTYGHHHPDYMRGAAEAITSKQPATFQDGAGTFHWSSRKKAPTKKQKS
jgi:integrase